MGMLRGVNTSCPQYIASRDDGIQTYQADPPTRREWPSWRTWAFGSMRVTYGDGGRSERLFAVGSRGDADTRPAGPTRFTNLLYQFDPDTGKAISAPQADRTGNARMQGAGTQIVERGQLDTNAGGGPGGLITGLAVYDGKLYALSETSGVFLVQDPLTDHASLRYIGGRAEAAGCRPRGHSGSGNERQPGRRPGSGHGSVDASGTMPTLATCSSTHRPTIKHITVQGTATMRSTAISSRVRRAVWTRPRVRRSMWIPGTASSTITWPVRHERDPALRRRDRRIRRSFVDSGSGGLNNPGEILFGPDGYLYVASTNSDAILRYDGSTGAFRDFFVRPGTGGLDGPTGMLFHTDGHLYVSSSNTHEVIRFNGVTGRFMNVFVTPATVDLTNPYGLTFGADGKLYVASQGTNSVLRYNGTTGDFDQEFIPSGGGDLSAPNLGLRSDRTVTCMSAAAGTTRSFGTTPNPGAYLDAYVASGADSLRTPWGLIFDADGNLYVNSRGNDRVLLYNDDRIAPAWQWQAELPLVGPDRRRTISSGASVAIEGDTMIVGAPGDEQFGSFAGAVYVYRVTSTARPKSGR